ncbi:MAG: helix-turn-helix domain-containing protein [Sulfuricurvum sp.]|nr:helix-turn-helix domain-containing protein [Sulfuricurvum sp.]
MKKNKTYNCSFEAALDIIDGKWKVLILWHLNKQKTLRNGELVKLIPNITQKMLAQQLREMENNGLIVRKIYQQIPSKVEYSLTLQGEKLLPVLEALREWGIEYSRENGITLLRNSTYV